MRNLLLYVLGTGSIFYLAVLYNSRGFLALGAVALLLPPVFLYALGEVGRGLECALFLPPYPDGTGGYRAVLEVQNKSAVDIPSLRAKVSLRHMDTGRTYRVKLRGKVLAGQAVRLEGVPKRLEFGLWQIECSCVDCYDWLGIYRFRKKWGERQQVTLFPECYGTTVKAGVRTRLFLSDGETYHPQIGGDDPTEILKLRAYQKGDRPNRIHWKLSAKNGSLLVAEMGLPMGCNVVFFLDADVGQMGQEERAAFWGVVHSISQEMLQQECAHYLVWFDVQTQQLCRKAVRSPEHLMEFWGEILRFSMGRCEFVKSYGNQFKGEAYASRISFCQELSLSCNGKRLADIRPKDVKQQLLEIELIL